MVGDNIEVPGITQGVPEYIKDLIRADTQRAVEAILRKLKVAGVVTIQEPAQ